jgi:hypothetical protein
MTMRDTQPQREQLERLYSMLTASSCTTEDLRKGLLGLVTAVVGLVHRIEELQSEVNQLKGIK